MIQSVQGLSKGKVLHFSYKGDNVSVLAAAVAVKVATAWINGERGNVILMKWAKTDKSSS